MRLFPTAGLVCWLSAYPALGAQALSRRTSADGLLDRLVGKWTMTGTTRGKPATYDLDVTRVLQGRFVELQMRDIAKPPAYEARVFIGVDTTGIRYVAHWIDNFGASYSIPHATGEMRGDTIDLQFPYPATPFHDIFVYDPRRDTWMMRLDAGTVTGGWTLFALYTVHRR